MLVSPSLLSADFLNLTKDIEMINRSEADLLHLDIMDGVFVTAICSGMGVRSEHFIRFSGYSKSEKGLYEAFGCAFDDC